MNPIYFVSYADWGSRGKNLRHFVFSGGDGSPADTLETTVMQKDGALDWSADMFGGVGHNHTLLDRIIERLTPRKPPGDRPFEHGVKVENFPADALTIKWDNRVLDKPLQFEELAAKLHAQWPEEAQGKPGTGTASKEPETTPPAQVAAQQSSGSLHPTASAPTTLQAAPSSAEVALLRIVSPSGPSETHLPAPLLPEAPSPGTVSPAPPSAAHPVTSTSAEPITSPQTTKKTVSARPKKRRKGVRQKNANMASDKIPPRGDQSLADELRGRSLNEITTRIVAIKYSARAKELLKQLRDPDTTIVIANALVSCESQEYDEFYRSMHVPDTVKSAVSAIIEDSSALGQQMRNNWKKTGRYLAGLEDWSTHAREYYSHSFLYTFENDSQSSPGF
jgi:hypothetical protein